MANSSDPLLLSLMSSSSESAAKGKQSPAATIQELIDSEEDDFRSTEKQDEEDEEDIFEEDEEEDLLMDEEHDQQHLAAGGDRDLHYSKLKMNNAKLGMKLLLAQKPDLLLSPIAAACAVGNIEMLNVLLESRLFCSMKYVASFFTLAAAYPNDEVACEMFRMIKASIDACNGSEGNSEEYSYLPCLNCCDKVASRGGGSAAAPKKILK